MKIGITACILNGCTRFFFVLAAFLLSGCASVNWNERIGHYTKAEAVAELRKPSQEEVVENGDTKMVWKTRQGCIGVKRLSSGIAEEVYYSPPSILSSCVESAVGKGYTEVKDVWRIRTLVFDSSGILKQHVLKEIKGDGSYKLEF